MKITWHREKNKVGRNCYRMECTGKYEAGYVMDYRPGHPPWLGLPYFNPYGKHWYGSLKEAKADMTVMFVNAKLDDVDK